MIYAPIIDGVNLLQTPQIQKAGSINRIKILFELSLLFRIIPKVSRMQAINIMLRLSPRMLIILYTIGSFIEGNKYGEMENKKPKSKRRNLFGSENDPSAAGEYVC